MYFDAFVNNHLLIVMLGTSAMHNFVAKHMVKSFRLILGRISSKIKAINSKA